MKQDLLDILRCPVCKSELELKVTGESAGEIVTGTLTCKGCAATYPIADGIPDLLPPGDRD